MTNFKRKITTEKTLNATSYMIEIVVGIDAYIQIWIGVWRPFIQLIFEGAVSEAANAYLV